MANWWKEYKKKNNIDQEAKEVRQKSSAAPQRTSSAGRRSYPYTPSDETKAAAKSSTWWEDYKRSNNIYEESKAATERAKNLEKKLAQDKQNYDQYKAAQDQLAKNRRMDAAADMFYAMARNPWMSQEDLETASFQRSVDRYQRDLPLYQKSLAASTYSSGLHDQAYKQAQAAESAVKDQFQRYQQASQKAEEERLAKLYASDRRAYYAETMSSDDLTAKVQALEDEAKQANADIEAAKQAQNKERSSNPDMRPSYMRGYESLSPASDRRLDEAQARADSINAELQIFSAAQKLQGESYSRARGKQLIDEIAKGGEAANRAKTGKAMFDQQQARIAADTDVEIKDDLESSRGAYTASQKERQRRGYILGYDWDNVPEEQKQAVYALFTQSPQQAIELAKYYIADVRQAEDERRQAWYAQNALTAGVGLVASAGAHLAAAVDPFGEVGQELTRRGDNALTGGARWADTATGYQKIPEWVPIVGGKGAGDLYQTAGSVVQSIAIAAPAILAGRYDKAAAEVVSKLGLALMGSSAAASDYRESVAAGMDDDRAKLHALAAGVEEALFEEVSLDKLVSMDTSGGFKALVRNWLVQSGVEGSEELATGIANRITDELISGAGQSKVERRTSELIANGMSATQAKQQAESEWLTDTLYEGFSGFLSGGMMVGGNYALQGVANLAGRAANTVETRKAQRQAGAAISRSEGSVEALQAYAKDNGIEIKAVETAEQSAEQNAGESTEQNAVETTEQINQDGKQNSYSNRDYRAISDTNSKVTQSIRSEVRGKTVQEQQAVRDSLVEKYGEGIAPVVNNAISIETAARVRQEYGDVDSIQAARNQAVSEIKDESLRRAVSDGYDSAAYSLAASQGGEGGMDTMSRYIQQRRNTGSGSEMSMNATVTAQDGSTKTIAITGMSEDGKRVSLADGSEVAVKDLQADEDTTSAIQQLADLDLGADATKVLQAYQQSGVAGTEGYRWLMDYATAYNQGRTRQISLEQAAKRSSLDERTVMDAYTLGQQAANRETQAGLEKLKNLPRRKGASGRTANIDTTEIKGKTMSKSELEQFELANQYAQALGVDMTWFSSREKDGKFIDKNGAYENGKIYMDIHAGRNFAADLTSGILATMGHELTHFQQQYAPEEYQTLKEFLFEQIVKSSTNGEARLERLIWEKQRRSGYTLSRKAAEDEVVADACQKMLRDSKAVHDFASQQPEAANGVVRWLDKWFKRVRSIFGRGGNYSEEAQLMDSLEQDVKAAFGELWDKALKQAAKVHDEVGNIEKATTEGESKAQNSDRDAEYLDLAKDPEKNAAKLQEMVDEAAKDAGARTFKNGKVRHYYHGTTKAFTSFAYEKARRGNQGFGFYFAAMPHFAERYGSTIDAYILTDNLATSDDRNVTSDQVMQIVDKYGLDIDVGMGISGDVKAWIDDYKAGRYDEEHNVRGDVGILKDLQQFINEQTNAKAEDILKDFQSVFGYDGLQVGWETVLWDNGMMKKADPVTYDDSGNVIPLSERFNTENQDIRYSQREQYEEAVEASDVLTKYSLREAPAPQKTIKAYKAFYVKDGKLYPPMVSNNTNEEDKQTVKKASSGTMKGLETPVGVWLDADVGGIAVDENGVPLRTKTTGRLQVQNDKGGGTLAFRPGWHLGEWPDASQFNVKDPVTGALKSVMPDNLVFAECEIAADVDYQLEAYEYGISDKGGFSRTQAGLPRVPTNGYYKYRTNVDPTTAPWYITGAMKVTRILSDEERRQICNQFGVTPQKRASHKDIDLEAYGLKAGPVKQTENLERFRKNKASYDNDALLKAALEDENYSNAYVRRTLDFDNETLVKEFELDRISPDQVKKYRESYQSPEVMRSERESAAKTNVSLDSQSESAAPMDGLLYSERTWSESRFVRDRENAAKALAKALNVSVRKAKQYIDDINSVAKAIADDRVRLDYLSSPGRSAFKSNAEYGGSIDFSTLCKKRQLLTGTFNAIQHALANTVLTADDVLRVRQMMQDAGLEVNCGMCYVEGSRARMGEYNKTFLKLYQQYYPDNWQPKMEDVNTTDGLELMRMEHPECYEQYEHFYNNHGTLRSEDKAIFSSQAKPKEYQLRTEYKGEIKEKFQKDSTVEAKNLNGGLRMQSFSDFEIVHLIDCMQVIMDMSEVGLAGQAYTKVPEFAEALGRTGLKINLSLVAKGVDENGKLIFNDVEGMPHERAFGIREKYSENVGTILVVYDDAQLVAAMADDKVDFIIPFHRSQWRKSQYAAMGLPKTTKDYTYQQNEKWLNPKAHTHEYRGKTVLTKCTNYMPNEYWNFDLSGKQNAELYLAKCAEDGKRPKFYKLLQNNGDGSFSLKNDGSTDGYWKLLIDFKMYDNNGVGVPQQPVQPIFDMDNAMQMLDDYSGDPSRFPVAEGIVDEFVSQYKAEHPGMQYSERDYSTPSDEELLMQAKAENATSKNMRQLLTEYQARGREVEKMEAKLSKLKEERNAWREKSRHGGRYAQGLIDSKNRDIAKLEKQIHKYRDIMAGKANSSELNKLLKAEREKAEARVKEQKEAQFANYKDRKRQTEIRNRIKNLHAEMQRDLLKPREGHFVPESLIRPVVELLDMVNTQTNRAKSESAQAKIDAINAQYDKLKNDERYSMYYDETVKAMLVDLSDTLGGRSIYEMNSAELEDVYTAMKAMRTTVRNAIKADLIEKGKQIWEVGNELRQELRNGKGASRYLLEKYHMAMLSAERAFHRFGGYRQGSAWDKVYRMLDDAQLKMLNLEMQATRIFDPVLKAKADFAQAEKLTSIKEKDLVDVGLKDADGNAVKITRGMMLSLYMHLQNEENMRHLMYGGMTLPDYKKYYNGNSEAWGRGTVEIPALGAKVANLDALLEELGEQGVDEKYAEYKAEIEEMFESVRQNIEDKLTDYDRKWIAASKQFFDGFSRRELNKVTNELYGFSKAKVDNYFPIVTDSNFLKSEFDSISRNISLENAGFMKERVKAGNPILLEDITRTVNRQISNVSRYAGLTQALKQFGNIYNVQTKGFTDSVKKAMAKSYGKNGQEYIQNLITDMIGGRSQPGSIFDRIKGNYAQAVLSANLSVTIKQAASFPTAAATVGWKPILKALVKGGRNNRIISRADRTLIDTYSPLLWKRSQGAIDTEIGDMAHAQDWTKKAKWLMGWIEKTDIATVGRLWSAAEYYVQGNFKGLQKGTEEQIRNGESEYYRKVADVFNAIVEDTQPNYTVLQRPDILRNPNKLVRAMTMFSTQRFQNANILIDAVNEYAAMVRYDKRSGTAETKAARKAAKTKLTNAISSQVVSAVVLNVMTLVAGAIMHRMNPWRDDDDELTTESIMEEMLNGFASSMAGSFLGGSELYEAVHSLLTESRYYGNDVGGISTINEFATAVVQFGQQGVKLIGDENSTPEDWKKLAEKQLAKVGQYLAQMTGIPAANINKIIAGGKNHVIDAVNGEFFSFEAGVERSSATNARRFYKAWEAADEAKMDKVLTEVRNSGKSQQGIETAFNKAAKEAYMAGDIEIEQYAEILKRTGFWDDEKIGEKVKSIAREEFSAGLRGEEETIALLTELCGMDENKAWKTVMEWDNRAEHEGEEDYNYRQYEDFFAELDAGLSLDEAGKDYISHGFTQKQLVSAAVSHVKDLYQTSEIGEEKAIDLLLAYKEDMDEDKAWHKIREWDAKAEHADDEDYSYSQYDAIDAAIDANKDIKNLVKELTDHGVEEKNVTSHVKGYLVDRYVAGSVTESALKNQLSRYLGIVAKDDVDKILQDADCKKQYGVGYSGLDEEYRAGNVSKTVMRSALMKYGGLSGGDADKKIRWYDLQKTKPDLGVTEAQCNNWYDGSSKSRENGHESAKAAGMSIENYIKAKTALEDVKDANGNKTGEDEYIAALTKITWLTPRQKDALYYEKYKGTTKYSYKTW